ncbi:hypothetical protein MtrunA17_Chr1g0209301 [Medicago truncatula]|uniref:Transmembrane protein n=1 Tax=Medicago truncatula TaxID=3880 RepID=A0A396K366_MEDTR|nr:hypothetical protein MtrunA17_Chr1g0209301 [Medicago truncatula]
MDENNDDCYHCYGIRIGFLAAEACLLVGSTTSAYKTKYQGYYSTLGLSCSALRKGVFAVGAVLTLFSMLTSILYYWAYCKADIADFWMRHQNEDIEMDTRNHVPERQ